MTAFDDTLGRIVSARSWDQRVSQIRLIPQRHGIAERQKLFAEIARELYVPHLAPDFAYVRSRPFFELNYFQEAYRSARELTRGFRDVAAEDLAAALRADPRTLLVFRTITGLLRDEFAHSTKLVGELPDLAPMTGAQVNAIESRGKAATPRQAETAANTLVRIMDGSLFGDPPGDLRSKQDKPDTADGWESVRNFDHVGVPYAVFLHQRHYGGAFRQFLDSTSSQRGDVIEDAVEALFKDHGIPYVRTGSHSQGDIVARFEVLVSPAPDFVVHDQYGTLRAMLECKASSDGGTARDKALRFERLKDESVRLGGVPLVAVLGGMGWARVNDTLGPVVRDTDGRVFTLANLPEMLGVTPFSSLTGLADVWLSAQQARLAAT